MEGWTQQTNAATALSSDKQSAQAESLRINVIADECTADSFLQLTELPHKEPAPLVCPAHSCATAAPAQAAACSSRARTPASATRSRRSTGDGRQPLAILRMVLRRSLLKSSSSCSARHGKPLQNHPDRGDRPHRLFRETQSEEGRERWEGGVRSRGADGKIWGVKERQGEEGH